VTGRYFDDCNEAVVVTEPGDLSGGVAPYALDQNETDRLWDAPSGRCNQKME
jgi:hypothetical protein